MFDKLLSTPTQQVGKVSRFVIAQVKLWIHCFRLLGKNRAGQQAAALSYHTIFGIVPFAIVLLLVFRLSPGYIGIGEKVKSFIYDQLQLSKIEYPQEDTAGQQKTARMTDHLDNIIAKAFDNLNEGTIAIFGVVLIVWAALDLLSTIERAFNNIWGLARGRGFVQRIINYWALLTLGPLLVGAAIYVTTQYAAISRIQQTVLAHIAPAVVSYLVAVVAFFLLYFVLPNARVQVKAAIWGAAVAALVWSIAKVAFRLYVVRFIPYNAIYGILGFVPLGVFWIYISWFIVLFGLQLTFTTQHLKTLDAAEIAAARKPEDYFIANDVTVINIVREIAAAFEGGSGPVEPGVICSKLNIPAEFVEKILRHLVSSSIVLRVSEPKDGFVPAKDPANMKLSEITAALAAASFAQTPAEQSAGAREITASQEQLLSQHNVKQMI